MLETIHEFAAEQLDRAEHERLLRRLLEHLIEVAEAANLHEEAGPAHHAEFVLPERANIDVALAWALAAGEIDLGLRLLWLLELYWSTNDPAAGRRWVDAFLARAGDSVEQVLVARALRFSGAMYDMVDRSDLAGPEYERSLALFRELGNKDAAAHLVNRVAMAALQAGDPERAQRLGSEALEVDRRRGHRRDESIALGTLGGAALELGRGDEGVRLLYESAALAGEIGFDWWRGGMLLRIASWLAQRDPDEAERALLQALETVEQINDRVNTPYVLTTAARIAVARGDAFRAGLFWGAVEAGEERELVGLWSAARDEDEGAIAAVAGHDFEQGRERGRTLSREAALDAVRAPID
jgi:tetratricopeptide (TPR) repeat protein